MTYFQKNSLILLFLSSLIFGQNSGNQIYGFITDSTSGEALIGANVFIRETGQGMATDNNGYYVLSDIQLDEATLIVSYVGYVQYEKNISFQDNSSQNLLIALKPDVIELFQVDVSAEEIERLNKIEPSRITLSPRVLKAQPSLAEPDIFRTIQSLPGVLTTSEFSTGLVIRGGNTDQNLILLDGITVYNPSHLGGLFSNFIVDAVKEAELIKGGYNAEYGGRLSAVLDIRSREGNRNKFEGSSSISVLSAQTTLEGPFLNGAWLLAGRRTYFDKVLPLVSDFNLPYYFYDLQGHVFTDLNEKDRLSLSFYRGVDDLQYTDLDLNSDWGNETMS
ncbi:MAG: TonB-dependent receptor, partial [Candidatus Marinimicrobia bacterium]|nr:TonB-dependent receptor [Candidatus Neomarinimicrobiota bacterium]